MISDIYNEMRENSEKFFSGRKIVFGEGIVNADILLVGEAPGGEEERLGRPFVGSAGKNLDKFLEIVKLERNNIYITNVVKLRPFKLSPKTNKPVNRPPNKEEIQFFKEYLYREIEEIDPKIIVTLGNTALRAVFRDNNVIIGDYHGRLWDEVFGFKVFPLYHPASVIYNRELEKVYLDDLAKLREALDDLKSK
ncbi:MAG: uracil-DNA glycosylase [Clostridiales bacterium]|nr:uracil-DNA glycosylase [Clostridiales bacterium]